MTVRNGNDAHLENVARGNEKVLRARLADAVFFYEEDQKTPIETFLQSMVKRMIVRAWYRGNGGRLLQEERAG